MRALLLALALLFRTGPPPIGDVQSQGSPDAGKPAPAFDRALLISVDGLRSDALIAQSPGALPAFARLLSGASTLNARTDPDYTVTLPNHTCMLTGRPVLGEAGHGWIENDDAAEGMTLAKNKGAYVAGIFDVAHDRGLRTALFAGKSKFSLYDVSWGTQNGAADTTGDDQGKKKIDEYGFTEKLPEIADGALRNLKTGATRSLVFVHFAVTDLTAHAYGWDVTPGSKYMKAVAAVDREIGRILDGIQADETLRGRTAVVLTADHGGGAPFKSHDQTRMWVDYIIPFLVWTGDGGTPRDLYAINAHTRADPGLAQIRPESPGSKAALPPIRNGDAGNLVLALLGLPAIPGSTINAQQDLRILPER
jgi:predicted AlkP superfamily pyrophosphatase or phosphodiesterase